ncbi:MAG TPA: hypothetical protein VFZ65_02760 [Planctomycetota bacterium]|nr:hypothetical protein [Planctomycetota bacterium]
MRTPILACLFTSLALTAAPAQTASVTLFGTGCTYMSQPLAIGVQGLPQFGTMVSVTYTGPNLNNQLSIQPVLALGLAPTNIPIPATILPQQPLGCTQWIVPELLTLMPPTATGMFETHLDLTIPNDPTLAGFTFTAQWLAIVIQCGIVAPCWLQALPTSDAALLTVGL